MVVLCHGSDGYVVGGTGTQGVVVFWTVAIGERALSVDPWCTLNVAWTSGVHSGAEWRSWVDGYCEKPAVLGEGFPAN